MKRAILLAAMLGLAACDTIFASFKPAATSDLQVGKTTYDQAVSQLGKPTDEMALPDGRKQVTYVYQVQGQSVQAPTSRGGVTVAHAGPGPSAVGNSAFQLVFDPSGVLQSYTWTSR